MPKITTRSRRNSKFSPIKNSENFGDLNSSYNSEISNSSSENSNDELQELKNELNSQLKELVFYKIEMPSSSSNKKIITCIEKILEIFNKIFNGQNEEDSEIKKKEKEIKQNNKDENNLKITSLNLAELENEENKNQNQKKINLNNFSTFEVNFIFY